MAENLLKGKKGIIFGALNDQSIAWKTAIQAHAQGAELVLTNAPVAMRMGEIHELAKQVGGAPVVPADATSVEDLTNLFEQAMEHFGGQVDFVLHSIGMSPNVRKGKHYTDINYNWLQTTLDVSAISLHKTLAVAKKLDAISEWGSVVALTYIAAQRIFPDYGDMADAKGFDEFIAYSESMSPLGNADGEACADYCISLFSDLTRFVTMQNLFHDGGFSNTGVSQEVIGKFGPDA